MTDTQAVPVEFSGVSEIYRYACHKCGESVEIKVSAAAPEERRVAQRRDINKPSTPLRMRRFNKTDRRSPVNAASRDRGTEHLRERTSASNSSPATAAPGVSAMSYQEAVERGIVVGAVTPTNHVVGAVTPNQCDGCARGLPINSNGNHCDNSGLPVMVCTKDLYNEIPIEPGVTTFSSAGVEVLRLDKDGLVYKGTRVLDAGQAYTAFTNWLKQVNAAPTSTPQERRVCQGQRRVNAPKAGYYRRYGNADRRALAAISLEQRVKEQDAEIARLKRQVAMWNSQSIVNEERAEKAERGLKAAEEQEEIHGRYAAECKRLRDVAERELAAAQAKLAAYESASRELPEYPSHDKSCSIYIRDSTCSCGYFSRVANYEPSLRALAAALQANGPQVENGCDGEGKPRYTSMRQAWEEALQAASVEAGRVETIAEAHRGTKLSLVAANTALAAAQVQIKNQEAQITGHHKYVGQDYQFRIKHLEEKLAAAHGLLREARVKLLHMQADKRRERFASNLIYRIDAALAAKEKA